MHVQWATGTCVNRNRRPLPNTVESESTMSGLAIVSLVAYSFLSCNRGQYGRTFLSICAASALFVVTFVLPLMAHALSAAIH